MTNDRKLTAWTRRYVNLPSPPPYRNAARRRSFTASAVALVAVAAWLYAAARVAGVLP